MKPRRGPGRRWAGGPLAALALLVGAGCATQRPGDRTLYPPPAGAAEAVAVYVTYNGFHSDLNVPTALLTRGGGPSAAAIAQLRLQPWTVLGWGDATFYQGAGFGVGRALDLLHSALWPVNASVVHVGGDRDPTAAVPGWRTLKLTLSSAGVEKLKARLDASFALSDGGPVVVGARPAGVRPDALFFQDRENAWALHVCNHWTAELLNAAGAPITPVLDLTAAGLAADLKWRAGAVPVHAR